MRCLKARLRRVAGESKSAGTARPGAQASRKWRGLVGLALEVRDLVGLCVRPLLRVAQLFLGLALALLLPALAAQARVVGEVPRGLLHAARQLVNDSHSSSVVALVICPRAPVTANRRRGAPSARGPRARAWDRARAAAGRVRRSTCGRS